MIFQNEIILLLSVVVLFGGLVATFRFFGKDGIYCWNVICTIAANIEVLILVDAFGMEMTLGNVIFASTFLATDICSELYGKKVPVFLIDFVREEMVFKNREELFARIAVDRSNSERLALRWIRTKGEETKNLLGI